MCMSLPATIIIIFRGKFKETLLLKLSLRVYFIIFQIRIATSSLNRFQTEFIELPFKIQLLQNGHVYFCSLVNHSFFFFDRSNIILSRSKDAHQQCRIICNSYRLLIVKCRWVLFLNNGITISMR